jgi:hypothetical protein
MSDERLDEFLDELRVDLDGEIAQERRVIAPDFAALVAAAHARNPELISEAAVREANELAPIVELGRESARFGHDDADARLDAWILAAREVAEAEVAARRLAGVPPLREAREPGVASRSRWLPALAVAAAIAGLAVAVPRLFDAFVDGNYKGTAVEANQAEYLGPGPNQRDGVRLNPDTNGQVAEVTPPIQHTVPPEPEPEPEPKPKSERASELEPKNPTGDLPSKSPDVSPRAKSSEASELARDRIEQLDADAQAAWAKGDLAGAERRFREIIELARKHQRRYADLAYGDLFTLARQRSDEAAERALWVEYLERFPRGRFADDARAGLCRRGSASEGCWEAYLDDFPEGVHTRAARRALGLEPPDAESP